MKEIKTRRGFVAIVDDEDFEWLSKYKWCYDGKGYATRNIILDSGTRTMIFMHVEILGKIDGLEIDHVDGNGLNNSRENLRHVTHAENMYNAVVKGGSSKYKGVSWNKGNKKWASYIKIDGKLYHLGTYKSERDAAWVYNVWAESFFGECARLNTIQEE